MNEACRTLPTPIGTLTLTANDRGLTAILFGGVCADPSVGASPDHPVLAEAARQLGEYFAGARTAFDLPLDFVGTDFQQQVWTALLAIPFGETRSYADIARAVGRPSATRAVGAANGRNPLPIVAPCHRVIGSDGSLTGFGGGIETKRFLLAHERQGELALA